MKEKFLEICFVVIPVFIFFAVQILFLASSTFFARIHSLIIQFLFFCNYDEILPNDCKIELVFVWRHFWPYRNPLLLRALQADEEGVEAVRVLVGLDHDAVLADSANTILFRIASPRKSKDKFWNK